LSRDNILARCSLPDWGGIMEKLTDRGRPNPHVTAAGVLSSY